MIGVTFAQVIMRYVFNDSFFGAEERALPVHWFTLSATSGLDRGIHFAMDVIIAGTAAQVQAGLALLVHMIVLGILAVLIVRASSSPCATGASCHRRSTCAIFPLRGDSVCCRCDDPGRATPPAAAMQPRADDRVIRAAVCSSLLRDAGDRRADRVRHGRQRDLARLAAQVPLMLVVQRIYAGSVPSADGDPVLHHRRRADDRVARMTDSLVELARPARAFPERAGAGDDSRLHDLRGHLRVEVSRCSCDRLGADPQLVARNYPKAMPPRSWPPQGRAPDVIPPYLLMIIYAAIAEQSVGQMFLGSIIPGILIGLGLMVVAHVEQQAGWEVGNDAASPGAGVERVQALSSRTGHAGGDRRRRRRRHLHRYRGRRGGRGHALLAAIFYAMSSADQGSVRARRSAVQPVAVRDFDGGDLGWIMARRLPRLMSQMLIEVSGGNGMLAAVLVIMLLLVLGFFVEVSR